MVNVTNGKEPEAQYVDSARLKKIMGWSDSSLRTFLELGLPHFRPRKKIYYRLDEVDAWMNKHRRGSLVRRGLINE